MLSYIKEELGIVERMRKMFLPIVSLLRSNNNFKQTYYSTSILISKFYFYTNRNLTYFGAPVLTQ